MDPLDTPIEDRLRRADPALGDEGFSEAVMARLPRRRIARTRAGRWTLGMAAVAGGLVAAFLGVPLDGPVLPFWTGNAAATSVLAVLLMGILAAPIAWAFYSE